MNNKNLSKKIALAGIMGALALSLSYLETLIPAYPGLPPGAKPGFSNIVTMFMACNAGIADTFFITVIKIIFTGITRGTTAMLMSASGGLLSTIAALVLLKMKNNKSGYIGIGIICSVCHNSGQLIAACILSGTSKLIIGYGPWLLIFAVITGCVTGTVLKLVSPALNKLSNRL